MSNPTGRKAMWNSNYQRDCVCICTVVNKNDDNITTTTTARELRSIKRKRWEGRKDFLKKLWHFSTTPNRQVVCLCAQSGHGPRIDNWRRRIKRQRNEGRERRENIVSSHGCAKQRERKWAKNKSAKYCLRLRVIAIDFPKCQSGNGSRFIGNYPVIVACKVRDSNGKKENGGESLTKKKLFINKYNGEWRKSHNGKIKETCFVFFVFLSSEHTADGFLPECCSVHSSC